MDFARFRDVPELCTGCIIKGRCIDQAWIRLVSNKVSLIDHSIKTCVYSDHEKLKVELKLY